MPSSRRSVQEKSHSLVQVQSSGQDPPVLSQDPPVPWSAERHVSPRPGPLLPLMDSGKGRAWSHEDKGLLRKSMDCCRGTTLCPRSTGAWQVPEDHAS